MITIDQALAIMQENLPPRTTESVSLPEALGRVLAEPVYAPEPSPRNTNSAMDGFAVKWDDICQAAAADQPTTLEIIGESRAGIPYAGTIHSGLATRISTGAVLPAGTDTIIPVEQTSISGSQLTVLQAQEKNQHVRFAGEEFQAGDLLLPRETGLYPAQIALLASVGITAATVYRRPTVGLVVTGTELTEYDRDCEPYQIRDANSIMLATAAIDAGAKLATADRVGDSLDDTVAALEHAAGEANLLFISGGVSVGEHDHVKDAAARIGFEPLFWRVRQKPGKPLFFARRGDVLLFGLPGNPVSALMGFVYYIYPVIQKLAGRRFSWLTTKARLKNGVTRPLNRPNFARVTISRDANNFPVAEIITRQGSHMLTSMTSADGFVLLPENTVLAADQLVDVFPFPWGRQI